MEEVFLVRYHSQLYELERQMSKMMWSPISIWIRIWSVSMVCHPLDTHTCYVQKHVSRHNKSSILDKFKHITWSLNKSLNHQNLLGEHTTSYIFYRNSQIIFMAIIIIYLLKGTTGTMMERRSLRARSGHTCSCRQAACSSMGAGVACTCGRRGIPRHASLDGCTAASGARAPSPPGSGCAVGPTPPTRTRSTINITTGPSFDDQV